MLESFPDPLGKPMQIHEITRKPIKEDVVSGLTNMLYKSAGVANPLDSLDQKLIVIYVKVPLAK